jgi:hypothetical protein
LSSIVFNTTGSPSYTYDNGSGLSGLLAEGATLSNPTAGNALFIVNGNCYWLDPSTDWTYLYSTVVAAAS